MARRLLLPVLCVPLLAACDEPVPIVRDWQLHPAVATATTTSEILAVGDVHGGYDRLVALLLANGVIVEDRQSPVAYSWSAGSRILVCTGDVIDKADRALPTIDLLQALAAQAPASGGQVIVTMGNHEAEFLSDPLGDKTKEFREELRVRGLDPRDVAGGNTSYGAFLHGLPFAARVNRWFFSHSGNSGGRTLEQLGQDFQAAVSAGDWSSSVLLGTDSLLEARKWWEADPKPKTLIAGYLAALDASHIVFGHDPSALDNVGHIADDKDSMLVLIDVGMSPAIDYSPGELLVVAPSASEDVASRLSATAEKKKLFSSPP